MSLLPTVRKQSAPEKPAAPTTELGRPGVIVGGGVLPWSIYVDDRERVPELTWPRSVATYTSMQGDAQVKGLLLAMSLPIRRFRWEIIENEAQPDVVTQISESLNLPIRGQEPKPSRRRKRFNHDTHLAHALIAPGTGHMHFERVYEYRDPAEGGDGRMHLKKLGTRPPRSIMNIAVQDNGELEAIEQFPYYGGHGGGGAGLASTLQGIVIPADRLLVYRWDTADDGDQVGRPLLRACYRDWLIKDRLLRVDATKHERNGMGIPWFEVDPNASKEQIEALAAIAEEIRAGERGGGAGPGRLRIAGTEGALPDTVGSIRYHDQQMSRAFLAMFMDLGQTETGSRALGAELMDFYTQKQGAVADWYAAIMQEQIEDEVAINWGEDEQPPALGYTRLETSELSMADLSTAVEKGLIEVDDELRSYIVQRWKLPSQPEVGPEEPEPPTVVLPPGMLPPAPADKETEGDMEAPVPALPPGSKP